MNRGFSCHCGIRRLVWRLILGLALLSGRKHLSSGSSVTHDHADMVDSLAQRQDEMLQAMERRLQEEYRQERETIRNYYYNQLDALLSSFEQEELDELSGEEIGLSNIYGVDQGGMSQRRLLTIEELNAQVTDLRNKASDLEAELAHVKDIAIDIDVKLGPLEDSVEDICFASKDAVLPSDTVLERPTRPPPFGDGMVIAPIVAYDWRQTTHYDDAYYELPIYSEMDREGDDFWVYLVDELLLARVHVVMLTGRGCFERSARKADETGPGNMCPRVLSRFVNAVNAAGAQDVIRVGMFEDTEHYKHLANVGRLDLSLGTSWDYVWLDNIKAFFDTIPKSMWYLMDGRPVIASFHLHDSHFQNQQGNASRMLNFLKNKFRRRYGVEPMFVLHHSWFTADTSIREDFHAQGKHGWFFPIYDSPSSIMSVESYNGENWAVTAPSYREPGTLPGCGASGTCSMEVTRRNGTTLYDSLEMIAQYHPKLVLVQGWTNIQESAGLYRSLDWSYPSQYINIIRKFADPEPRTLRLEAEAADFYNDTTTHNEAGNIVYSNRSLDVKAFNDGSGWYVGFVQPGEWLEYSDIHLGCGTYRFTARASTRSIADDRFLRLEIRGPEGLISLPTVEVPTTPSLDFYTLVHLGEEELEGGSYDLRFVMESSGSMNIDWFFVKRSTTCTCEALLW